MRVKRPWNSPCRLGSAVGIRAMVMHLLVDFAMSVTPAGRSGRIGRRGWSVRHRPLASPRKRFWLDNAGSIAFVVSAIFGYAYLQWSLPRLGIGVWEVSWRAFYASLPATIPMFVVLALQFWKLRRLSRRQKSGWVEN